MNVSNVVVLITTTGGRGGRGKGLKANMDNTGYYLAQGIDKVVERGTGLGWVSMGSKFIISHHRMQRREEWERGRVSEVNPESK